MSLSATAAEADHAQALADLEAGRPLRALRAWRHLLRADRPSAEICLQAAASTLERDAVAPLRRQAIALARSLLSHAFLATCTGGPLAEQATAQFNADFGEPSP